MGRPPYFGMIFGKGIRPFAERRCGAGLAVCPSERRPFSNGHLFICGVPGVSAKGESGAREKWGKETRSPLHLWPRISAKADVIIAKAMGRGTRIIVAEIAFLKFAQGACGRPPVPGPMFFKNFQPPSSFGYATDQGLRMIKHYFFCSF